MSQPPVPATLQDALQQLAQQQEELERLRAYVQGMGKVLAHDLRAPLRHVISFAPLLRESVEALLQTASADPAVAADAIEFADTMEQAARKMADMLTELVAQRPSGF